MGRHLRVLPHEPGFWKRWVGDERLEESLNSSMDKTPRGPHSDEPRLPLQSWGLSESPGSGFGGKEVTGGHFHKSTQNPLRLQSASLK